MPKYEGSCGCYSYSNAKRYGLVAAILMNFIEDKQRFFSNRDELIDGMFWSDQKDIAEQLAIEERVLYRAISKLESEGIIIKRVGYKPGTQVRTTWWKLNSEDASNAVSETTKMAVSETTKMVVSILKKTNNNNTDDRNSENAENEISAQLNPSSVLSALKRVFKQAGYSTVGGKALRDKASSFVADIADSELTLDMVVDSAKAYLKNDYYDNKSLMNFMNAKVFAYNAGKKTEQEETIVRYGE